MRLWSLHPQYLDRQGLLACWREGLLAQKVLMGETKGYKNHPQLERFKNLGCPLCQINYYLYGIREEGLKRGYKFKDLGLPSYDKYMVKIPLNQGQLNYEFGNLQRKLYKRNKNKYEANKERFLNEHTIQPHPLFYVVEGNIEKWEKIK